METKQEKRIAIIGIAVQSKEEVGSLNATLSEYGEYIISRNGIPYRDRGIQIITVIVDAPNDIISALSGKLGRLKGIDSKVSYLKV